MTDEVVDNSPEPTAAAEGTEQAQAPAPEPTVEERLKVEREARLAAEKSYENLRSHNDRRFNQQQAQIEQLRGQTAQADPEAAAATAEAQRLSSLEERQAITDFRVSHPDHTEVWDDMLKYAQENPHQVLARREDGQIDYQNTLDNAYSRVRLRTYEAKAAKDREAAAVANAKRTENKAQATISGGTVVPAEAPPNVENMTADEMVLKGYIEYDENDPPSIIRKKRQGLVK